MRKEGCLGQPEREIFELCDKVRAASLALHGYLRHGHMEKVYENGLSHRLRTAGIVVQQQYPLHVADEDGTPLGAYFADLLVGNALVVEIKACRALCDEHVAQLLGYLRASRREHGLLINFGARKLEIRKFVLSALPSCASCASLRPSKETHP